MTPLDFNERNEPRDLRLFKAAQEYCKRELGEEQNFLWYIRAWVVEAVEGETAEVVGIATVWNVPDVPIFHVTMPQMGKGDFKIAEQATNMMFMRLNWYLADTGNRGRKALVHVAPEKERLWRRFFKRIGGNPANRYQVEVR